MEIPVKELRDALGLLDPAVPRGPTLPVLHNILLEGTRARATDLEVDVSVDIEREVGEPFCIPHPQFHDLLEYTPGDTILTLTPGATLSVKMRTGSATLVPGWAPDYPPVPYLEDPKVAVLDGSALVKALAEILPYAAKSDARPVLTALCITLGDPVEVAAADGFRLTIQQVPAKLDHLSGQRLLIPAHAVKVLGHLWKRAGSAPSLEDGDGPAQIAMRKRLLCLEYDSKLARITFGKVTMITQLVQGSFPNYRTLVPSNPASVIRFLAEDMERAVRMLAPMASKGSDIIRLRWEDGVLTLEASATEEGSMSTEVRLLDYDQLGRIAIKAQYLGALFRTQRGIVAMETTSPSAPALFKSESHPLVVMMPMFVQQNEAQAATEGQPPEVGQASEPEQETSVPPVTAGKERKRRKKG